MLEKYVIRLKNIIFLKAVLYLIIIVVLSSLIPKFVREFQYSLKTYEQDLSKHNEIAKRLNSIADSEEKILSAGKTYEKVVRRALKEDCDQRVKIAKEIEALQQTYKLANKIYIDFSTSMASGTQLHHIDPIVIRNYDLHLKYSTSNIQNSLALVKDAFAKMPANSVITSIEFTNREILDLQVTSELASYKKPEMIKANVSMRMRIISSNKVANEEYESTER